MEKYKADASFCLAEYGEKISIVVVQNGLKANLGEDSIELSRNNKTVKITKGELRTLMDYIDKTEGILVFEKSISDVPRVRKIKCEDIVEKPWSKVLRFGDLKQFVDNNRDLDKDTPVLIERLPDFRVEGYDKREVVELEAKGWKFQEEWCKKLSKDLETLIVPREEDKDQFFVSSYIEKDKEAVLIYCNWYEKR